MCSKVLNTLACSDSVHVAILLDINLKVVVFREDCKNRKKTTMHYKFQSHQHPRHVKQYVKSIEQLTL